MLTCGQKYSHLKQALNLIRRPLFFISGVFFSLQSIPQWLRPWLSWNPILQAIELSRKAFSANYLIDELISLPYLISFTFSILALGMFIYINNEKILLTK